MIGLLLYFLIGVLIYSFFVYFVKEELSSSDILMGPLLITGWPLIVFITAVVIVCKIFVNPITFWRKK